MKTNAHHIRNYLLKTSYSLKNMTPCTIGLQVFLMSNSTDLNVYKVRYLHLLYYNARNAIDIDSREKRKDMKFFHDYLFCQWFFILLNKITFPMSLNVKIIAFTCYQWKARAIYLRDNIDDGCSKVSYSNNRQQGEICENNVFSNHPFKFLRVRRVPQMH